MEDFEENKARLSKQMIQHWDVAQLGFLKHVSPDVDVENFTAFLSTQVNKLQKSRLKLGLRIKTPWDGGEGQKDRQQLSHLKTEYRPSM